MVSQKIHFLKARSMVKTYFLKMQSFDIHCCS